MTTPTNLSDKALSVFAFAAYHQLESGQKVTKVIRRDGSGHQADPEAVQELESRGLVTATDDELSLEPEAERILERIVEGMRRSASGG